MGKTVVDSRFHFHDKKIKSVLIRRMGSGSGTLFLQHDLFHQFPAGLLPSAQGFLNTSGRARMPSSPKKNRLLTRYCIRYQASSFSHFMERLT